MRRLSGIGQLDQDLVQPAAALAGVLLLLYGALYVLLQLEDFALLTGTALLLLGLAALMFTTKSLPRAVSPRSRIETMCG